MLCTVASAHEARPGYLEIRETSSDMYEVTWKVPARGDMRLRLDPIFAEDVAILSDPVRVNTGTAFVDRFRVRADGGLAGKEVFIAGLAATLTDVLVRVTYANGAEQAVRLSPANPSFVVQGAPSFARSLLTYLFLGLEHIALGVDHLLFVLGLLLIVKSRWMLIKTVTSFTVAHSLTLGAATLGFAKVPIESLNAAIALSILFLGPEIVRVWRNQTSFTIEHPWVVAFVFGLLHGFGFASGLMDLGIPQNRILPALLMFNVGVELGQIAFVLMVFAIIWSWRELEIRFPKWATALPGYTVGSVGAYWTLQRVVILF